MTTGKSKQVVFLVLALVVVVLAVVRFRRESDAWKSERLTLGQELLTDFEPGRVKGVDILSNEGQVRLRENEDEFWVVDSRYGYPARFPALGSLVATIEKQTVKRFLPVEEALLERLGLNPEPPLADETLVIRLLDVNGEPLKTLVLGAFHWLDESARDNPRAWPQGRYAYVPEQRMVALVSEPFKFVRTDPTEWLEQRFIELGGIQTVDLLNAQGDRQWRMVRSEEVEGMELVDAQNPEQVDADALRRVAGAFSWIAFADVVDPDAPTSQTGLDEARIVRVQDQAGNVTEFRFGRERKEDGLVYARISVQLAERTDTSDETGEDPGDEDIAQPDVPTPEESYAEKMRELAERVEGWTYLLRSSQFADVLVDREKFLMSEDDLDAIE